VITGPPHRELEDGKVSVSVVFSRWYFVICRSSSHVRRAQAFDAAWPCARSHACHGAPLARLGHLSALPPPSCSLISPLLSVVCARPRPPWTVGRACCHHRSLLRPRSQSPHSQVRQSLHHSVATALIRSQQRSSLCHHRAFPCRAALSPSHGLAWPGQLGPPRAEPSCPLGVHDSPDAPLLLHRHRLGSYGRQWRTPAPPLL